MHSVRNRLGLCRRAGHEEALLRPGQRYRRLAHVIGIDLAWHCARQQRPQGQVVGHRMKYGLDGLVLNGVEQREHGAHNTAQAVPSPAATRLAPHLPGWLQTRLLLALLREPAVCSEKNARTAWATRGACV